MDDPTKNAGIGARGEKDYTSNLRTEENKTPKITDIKI